MQVFTAWTFIFVRVCDASVTVPFPTVSLQPVGPAPGIVKTANPWKAGGVQDPSEKLYKTVKGVLNKLTPDNYEKLFNQIVDAGISNADMLRGVISLVSAVDGVPLIWITL